MCQMRLPLDAEEAIRVDPGMSPVQVSKLEKRRKAVLKWRARNPHKRRAHVLVAWALKWGKLKKPKACEWCGEETYLIGHHESYIRPLHVNWICDRCHARHHARKTSKPRV